MRRIFVLFTALFLMLFVRAGAFAGETGHYPLGSEGIKSGTLPPPGLYYRTYNSIYYADTVTSSGGHDIDINYQLTILATVHRFVWVSDFKIFEADYFADIVVPFQYTEVEAKALGPDDHDFGLADINIEYFGLAWHQQQYDFGVGQSIYVPVGEYSRRNPASPGKDFWTHMSTVGLTYYLDPEKSLSAAILARYEIHSEKNRTSVRPGRNILFEYGIAKAIGSWQVGVSGYAQWQIGDDSGSAVTWDKGVHDRVHAIGPEVVYVDHTKGLNFSLRYLKEFGAVDRPEGHSVVFTFAKRF
jgi:hypothetical protein